MGKNGGKWRKMGGNGGKWRKMEENGGGMGNREQIKMENVGITSGVGGGGGNGGMLEKKRGEIGGIGFTVPFLPFGGGGGAKTFPKEPVIKKSTHRTHRRKNWIFAAHRYSPPWWPVRRIDNGHSTASV